MARSFNFETSRTCVIVGAGASKPLPYPSFGGEEAVRPMLESAVAGLPPSERGAAAELVERVACRYNWDLERVYDHLTHTPPGLYEPQSNTDWICQLILKEIASRFNVDLPADVVAERANRWASLIDGVPRPIALFTTNFDTVLERALEHAAVQYADGWSDGAYVAKAFGTGPEADVALVKLHGSADWEHSRHHTSRRILRAGAADVVTAQPACLAPTRRKWATEEPYVSAYCFLEAAMQFAEYLVIVGFSCRDESVLSALYRALSRRGDTPLQVRVVDPYSEAVEERVRLFMQTAGAGQPSQLLSWHHLNGGLMDVNLAGLGAMRGALDHDTSLDVTEDWVEVLGEPQMSGPVEDGRFTVRWTPASHYFESGRVVLLPMLPERYRIDLRMVIKSYGRGWNPGFSLETDAGDEILCARFIPKDPEDIPEPVWRYADEENVNGIQVASGLVVHGRYSVTSGTPVEAIVIGSPDETQLKLSIPGQPLAERRVPHTPATRPMRLHLGAYPWYSDDGLGINQLTECELGPCKITLTG